MGFFIFLWFITAIGKVCAWTITAILWLLGLIPRAILHAIADKPDPNEGLNAR